MDNGLQMDPDQSRLIKGLMKANKEATFSPIQPDSIRSSKNNGFTSTDNSFHGACLALLESLRGARGGVARPLSPEPCRTLPLLCFPLFQ